MDIILKPSWLIAAALFISVSCLGQDFASIAQKAAIQTDQALGLSSTASDIVIKPGDWNIDAVKYGIKPGDRVILQGPLRYEIEFHNLIGTAEAPITVTATEKVVIKGLSPGGRVVQFIGCDYVTFTGTPNYLIEITGGGQAVDFRELSNHPEASYLYIHDVGYLGIAMKTDPTCDPKTWRGAFILQNPRVHHNRIIGTFDGEGLYLGESNYEKTFPIQTKCASGLTTALVHDVTGVEVYENYFSKIGADAIQVGSATGGGFITNNTIEEFGTKRVNGLPVYGQSSGIQANPGSNLLIENNRITGGSSFGIIVQGRTGCVVRKNIVIGTVGAIFTVARETTDKGRFQVYNNTFVGILPTAGGYGVEVYTNTDLSSNIFQMASGTMMRAYSPAVITETTPNLKIIGGFDQLKLDANYAPLPGSLAYGTTSDIGAVQTVKKIVEAAVLSVETTGDVVEVYAITPNGKRIKIK